MVDSESREMYRLLWLVISNHMNPITFMRLCFDPCYKHFLSDLFIKINLKVWILKEKHKMFPIDHHHDECKVITDMTLKGHEISHNTAIFMSKNPTLDFNLFSFLPPAFVKSCSCVTLNAKSIRVRNPIKGRFRTASLKSWVLRWSRMRISTRVLFFKSLKITTPACAPPSLMLNLKL